MKGAEDFEAVASGIVPDLFAEYARVGVSIFQIYGYPFLEEALHVGERFLPVAKQRLAAL